METLPFLLHLTFNLLKYLSIYSFSWGFGWEGSNTYAGSFEADFLNIKL